MLSNVTLEEIPISDSSLPYGLMGSGIESGFPGPLSDWLRRT